MVSESGTGTGRSNPFGRRVFLMPENVHTRTLDNGEKEDICVAGVEEKVTISAWNQKGIHFAVS